MISILLAHPPINFFIVIILVDTEKSPRLCLKVNNHIQSVEEAFKVELGGGKRNKVHWIK